METLQELAQKGAEKALPEMLRLLEAMCSVDCGTGCEEGNRRVRELLRPVLEELGAQVEEVPAPGLGAHLVARVRPEGMAPKGKVLLVAHLDTVFGPGFAAAHPFHVEGDWAWGLGAGDCKSGVLAALFGALILKRAGQLPPWELTFLFTCDEEIGSGSGRQVYAREAPGAACALVFEGGREKDGQPAFVTARRGVILGDIQVTGREAHAGKAYREGRSAVVELAHQILRLDSFNDFERGIYFNVAPISGGRPNGIVAGEAQGQFCVAGLPTNEDFGRVEKQLASMGQHVTVEGCQVKVTWHTLFPAMERTERSGAVCAQVMEAARQLGWEPVEIADPSATDGTWLSTLGVPVVDAMSAMAQEIHTTQEHVSVSSLCQRTALCALALRQICV